MRFIRGFAPRISGYTSRWRIMAVLIPGSRDWNHGLAAVSAVIWVHVPISEGSAMLTPAEEAKSEVLISSAKPEPTEGCDVKPGAWIRSCPICRTLLMKSEPRMSVFCACGWQWES
jgi:hypothetical protein